MIRSLLFASLRVSPSSAVNRTGRQALKGRNGQGRSDAVGQVVKCRASQEPERQNTAGYVPMKSKRNGQKVRRVAFKYNRSGRQVSNKSRTSVQIQSVRSSGVG